MHRSQSHSIFLNLRYSYRNCKNKNVIFSHLSLNNGIEISFVHPSALLVKLICHERYRKNREEGEEDERRRERNRKGTSGEVFAIWIFVSALMMIHFKFGLFILFYLIEFIRFSVLLGFRMAKERAYVLNPIAGGSSVNQICIARSFSFSK